MGVFKLRHRWLDEANDKFTMAERKITNIHAFLCKNKIYGIWLDWSKSSQCAKDIQGFGGICSECLLFVFNIEKLQKIKFHEHTNKNV